jgi:hypothetical protein
MQTIRTGRSQFRKGLGATVLILACCCAVAAPAAWGAAAPAAPDGCAVCHTDAGKLKALTPPDPPSAETGEG